MKDYPSSGMPLYRKREYNSYFRQKEFSGRRCLVSLDKRQGPRGSRSTTFLAWHKLTLWWKEGHNKLRLEMRSSYSVELLDIYHIPSLALIAASVKGHLKISGGFFEVIITINIINGSWQIGPRTVGSTVRGPTVLISISPSRSS